MLCSQVRHHALSAGLELLLHPGSRSRDVCAPYPCGYLGMPGVCSSGSTNLAWMHSPGLGWMHSTNLHQTSWHVVNPLGCSLCPRSGESLGRTGPVPGGCSAMGEGSSSSAAHGLSLLQSLSSTACSGILAFALHHDPRVI